MHKTFCYSDVKVKSAAFSLNLGLMMCMFFPAVHTLQSIPSSFLRDIKDWMALSFIEFNEKRAELGLFGPNGSTPPTLLAQYEKLTASNSV